MSIKYMNKRTIIFLLSSKNTFLINVNRVKMDAQNYTINL